MYQTAEGMTAEEIYIFHNERLYPRRPDNGNILRPCEYCHAEVVEFEADDPWKFYDTPVCEKCADGMLWAVDGD